MPLNIPGKTFQPRALGNDQQRNRMTPVQEAIKLLSLRLPTTVNRGLAPQALLQGPGGGGMGGGAQVLQMLQRLLQPQGSSVRLPQFPTAPTAAPPMPQSSQPPMPRITPGDVYRPGPTSSIPPSGVGGIYEQKVPTGGTIGGVTRGGTSPTGSVSNTSLGNYIWQGANNTIDY